MRKLIVQMQTSVDDFVGRRADGGPAWQQWDWGETCPWDGRLQDRFNRFVAAADTILLSRNLAEGGYLDHWAQLAQGYPQRPFFAFARRITDIDKIVFSRGPMPSSWPRTESARGEMAEVVNALKTQRGANIVAFGGTGFAASLIAAGLVDALEFYVNPVALGDGQRIFPETPDGTALRLLDVTGYECGMSVMTYALPRSHVA